ncbi:nuclear transport factor 2 family protein [Marivirga atlantica]|jgi:hypothetical protein|uniref:Nuclear transport factor 2 family protein n=1 Tax=Marivirga atlantica TaxID=1548457 RepID=A0A937ABN4_9BACT|nr:hypothetical protein [Marivirga atlantica]MBL0763666.1 hypothetical protein [Marivirga atlantica]
MTKYILFFFLFMSTLLVHAQSLPKADSTAVMQIITDVFDGMRQGDSSMISQHLHKDIVMHSVGIQPGGGTKVFTESNPQAWLDAVGKPKEQTWDERTANYKMNLTEGLAIVWMDYGFFIDKEFSHCGVNSFQLLKEAGIWKIIYIIDTRKRQDCNISAFSETNQ